MKRKSLPAILLSMAVIAGAMTITTDAYAQTNTERLATVDARTAETQTLVEGIVESLGFLTGTVTDLHGMVTSVFESVTMVKDAVDSTSMKVDALDSKISMVAEDTAAHSAQLTEVADSISSDISDVSDAVASNSAAIRDLNDNVQTSIDSAVTALSAKADTNAAAIAEIQTALANVNTQLDEISTSLGVVQENVDVPVVSVFPAPLVEEKTDERNAVYLADFFKNTNEQDEDHIYNYDFTFSCEQDVVVQRVSIEGTGSAAGITVQANERATGDALSVPKNNTDPASPVHGAANPFHIRIGTTDMSDAEIRVSGQAALDNDYNLGGTTNVGSLRALSYGSGLLQLTAGSAITFTAEANFTEFISTLDTPNAIGAVAAADETAMEMVYNALTQVNQTIIDGHNAKLFTVVIDYIQSGDAECSISLDEAGDFANKDRVTVRLTPTVSDALTSEFEAMVSCNDKVTLFTDENIFVGYRGDNKDNAPTYIKVNLEGGNKVVKLDSSTNMATTLKLSSDSTDKFPVKLESGSLKISGTTLQLDEIVIQLPYQTAKGNSCTVVQ